MTKIAKSGRPKNEKKYQFILSQRKLKKSLTEIGAMLGMKRQGVSYYVRSYGDAK